MGFENNFSKEPTPAREYTPSEPSAEKDFDDLMQYCTINDSAMAGVLHDIDRKKTSGMKAYLESALAAKGHKWKDLQDLRENPQAMQAFNHLISFWDHREDDKSKTSDQHWEETLKFAGFL